MPAAMHLYVTVLMSLFAVAVSDNKTVSSTVTHSQTITTIASHVSSTAVSPPSLKPSNNTHTPTTKPLKVSTEVKNEMSSLPSTSLYSSKGTEVIPSSPSPTTNTTNHSVDKTPVFDRSTAPNINSTTLAVAQKPANVGLMQSPGLVAILCIFCIVLTLVIFVAIVKCVRSPRSNFERLEDVPMGKMNEESPFARH